MGTENGGGRTISPFRNFLRDNWGELDLGQGYKFAKQKAKEAGVPPDDDVKGQAAYSSEKARQNRSSGLGRGKSSKIDLDSAPLLRAVLEALKRFNLAGDELKAAVSQMQQGLSAKDGLIADLKKQIEELEKKGGKDAQDANTYRAMMAAANRTKGVQNSASFGSGTIDASRK